MAVLHIWPGIVYLYFQGYFRHLLFPYKPFNVPATFTSPFTLNLGIFHNTSRNHPKNSLQRRSMQSIGQIRCCRMIDRIPADRSVHIQRHSVNRKPHPSKSAYGSACSDQDWFSVPLPYGAKAVPGHHHPEYYIPVLKVRGRSECPFRSEAFRFRSSIRYTCIQPGVPIIKHHICPLERNPVDINLTDIRTFLPDRVSSTAVVSPQLRCPSWQHLPYF